MLKTAHTHYRERPLRKLVSSSRVELPDVLRAVAVCLALVSTAMLRIDAIGLAICGLAMLVMLLISQPLSIAAAMLIFGPKILGLLVLSFNIPVPGSILAAILALIAIGASRRKIRLRKLNWIAPTIWILSTLLVLWVSYGRGPRTDYSWSKLTGFTSGFLLAAAGLLLFIITDKINPREVGMLGLVASAAYFCNHLYLFPQMQPTTLFEFGGLRMAGFFNGEVLDGNNLASATATAVVLLLSPMPSNSKIVVRPAVMSLLVILAIALLSIAGQRLFVIGVPLALIAALLTTTGGRKRWTVVAATAMCACLTVVIYNSRDNVLVAQVTDSGTVQSRINREQNWSAAMTRISEEPVFGHGLGGYYIDNYSTPGSGTYAHNIVLELLTETGIIGTIIIVIPGILLSWRRCRPNYFNNSATALALWALLILKTIHAMISHDLTVSSFLFAVVYVGSLSARHGTTWRTRHDSAFTHGQRTTLPSRWSGQMSR